MLTLHTCLSVHSPVCQADVVFTLSKHILGANSDLEDRELHRLARLARIQTLEQRRNEQLLVMIYNILILRHDSYLLEELEPLNHGHNTRNNQVLHLPKPNRNYLKRTITYRGIQLWNSTIPLLQNFNSKATLKNCYRQYCLML